MEQTLGGMGTLAVEFEWPHEVANGKWLLYLTKIVVAGKSEMECKPPGHVVNELNLTVRPFFKSLGLKLSCSHEVGDAGRLSVLALQQTEGLN